MKTRDDRKPLLFLDVDGVINVFNDEPHERIYAPATTEAGSLRGLHAIVPSGVKERLLRLWPSFEVIWATAWLGSASPVFCPWLGVDSCEYVPWSNYKLPAILKRAGDRRWAWLDDDIDFELRGLGWTRDYVSGLLLQPDSAVGLADEQVEELLAFARSDLAKAPRDA